MKKNDALKQNKKLKSEKNRIAVISDMKFNLKIILVLLLAFVPLAFSFAGILYTSSEIDDKNQINLENAVVNSTKQYMNMSIENVVSIAKTIYSNQNLYNFLNTRYDSTEDYYDAFYKFNENKTLNIADTNIVKQYRIYTANDTILNGGSIGSISNIQNEKWYVQFQKSGKDIMMFCDSESRILSLIRKLNFVSVRTGEAIIKIDINEKKLQECFYSYNFEGEIYIVGGDVLLYSNNKDKKTIADVNLNNFTTSKENYYTVPVKYYVHADQHSVVKDVVKGPFNIIIIIFLIIYVLFIILISVDIHMRTHTMYNACDKKQLKMGRDRKVFGKDEIGILYGKMADMISEYNTISDQKKRLEENMSSYCDSTNDIMIKLYNMEAFIKLYEKNLISNIPDLAEKNNIIINIRQELENVEKYVAYINDIKENCIELNITSKILREDMVNILSFSLVNIAEYIIDYVSAENEKCNLELEILETGRNYIIKFKEKNTSFSSAAVIKLGASFESEEKYAPEFKQGSRYNPYKRLKRFYKNDISFNLVSKSEIELELIFERQCLNNIR